MRIKAGDSVFHKPSGEVWYILGVNYTTGKLCVAGWPPTIANIADCEFKDGNKPLSNDELEYRDKQFGSGWE